MEILVINGSPKGKGNTYKTFKMLEEAVCKRDKAIHFKYIHLMDCHLEMCRGCYNCLLYGEDKCPIHDDRKMLEQAMQEADGVIFMSPVYVMNVSGLFKNFLDRFAYICHRPQFHGKKAWFIATTGALGTGLVTNICAMSLASWGFETAGKLGVIASKGISKEESDRQWEKIQGKVEKFAVQMVKTLQDHRQPKASLYKLCAFKMQRNAFGSGDPTKADYQYWKQKGWLEPGCHYYIEAKINPVKKAFVDMLSFFFLKKR